MVGRVAGLPETWEFNGIPPGYVSHPYGNDSPADAFRGQLQDQTNLTLCASLSWILAWPKFYEKPRRHSQFLTAWFAGLHNRHSSWYRLDDELQEIRVTHTVRRRQCTTMSLWPVHVSDLSVAPKQTVVIVTSHKSLEILSSSMHVYATFVAARPLPSHCRWCLMLPHQEWSSYPWGFWPCSWAAENMATSWCITMTCCQSHKFMSCSLGIGRRSAWLQKPQGWRRVLEPISLTKRSWEAVSHAWYHVLTPLPHSSACLQLETIFSMSCDPWYCAQ